MTPEEIIAKTIEDLPDEGVTNAEAATRIIAGLRAKGLHIVGTGAIKPSPRPTIPDPTPMLPQPPPLVSPGIRGRCPNEGRPCFCTGACLRPPPMSPTWTSTTTTFPDDPTEQPPLGGE